MIGVNYGLCVLAILAMAFELYLIVTRNRKIKVKGKDDYFSFALVLLFAVLIFPVSMEYTVLTSLRNTLIFLALFGSLGIRRGLTEDGIAKSVYTVAWDRVESVQIDEYQTAKIQAVFAVGGRRIRLLFSKAQLRAVLAELEKHVGNIYMKKSLEQVLRMCKPL
ncbi:MAG TPA: hypothetical protein DF613_07045 [Lachnospiraceae bacterium]|nr:hypothetical protein [Lachnospiraceae bacterium]